MGDRAENGSELGARVGEGDIQRLRQRVDTQVDSRGQNAPLDVSHTQQMGDRLSNDDTRIERGGAGGISETTMGNGNGSIQGGMGGQSSSNERGIDNNPAGSGDRPLSLHKGRELSSFGFADFHSSVQKGQGGAKALGDGERLDTRETLGGNGQTSLDNGNFRQREIWENNGRGRSKSGGYVEQGLPRDDGQIGGGARQAGGDLSSQMGYMGREGGQGEHNRSVQSVSSGISTNGENGGAKSILERGQGTNLSAHNRGHIQGVRTDRILIPEPTDFVKELKNNDFRATEEVHIGSLNERFNKNISAIKTLQLLEQENRLPNEQEAHILNAVLMLFVVFIVL